MATRKVTSVEDKQTAVAESITALFTKSAERLDTATAQSPDIAILKARAAALGRVPSKALEDMVKDRPALGTFPNRAPVQGGLPIFYQGECVGGVGVSGVKSSEDEQTAAAGLAGI